MKKLLSGLAIVTLTTLLSAQSAYAQSATRAPMKKDGMNKGTMHTMDKGMDKGMGMAKKTVVGLEGYCPVCVVAKKKWAKGNPQIASTFDGVTYYFPSRDIKNTFDATPEKYVPAMNGDCIVCYEKMGKRAPGSVHHAALHRSRLYLFPSDKEKKMFSDNPRAFEKTDLAVSGECIVCLAKGKHVPGVATHTVFHNGLRYLFPSDAEAAMFRKSPEQFVTTVKQMDKKSMMMKTGMKSDVNASVQVAGRSGCAACEFGVSPLTSPDELGLAIVGNDGRVTVVEEAHKQYPSIYKGRFDGNQLLVEGTVLKTAGNVTWLRPTSLKAIN